MPNNTLELGGSGIKVALSTEKIELLPIELIDEHPDNDKIFNMNDIENFAEHIKENGFTTPIEVIPNDKGRYDLIAGERRFRALKLLQCSHVPAIFLPDMSSTERLEKLIFSNILSRELSPLDMARAIDAYAKNICTNPRKVMDEVCKKFNISKPSYYRYRNYLRIIPELQQFLEKKDFPHSALGTDAAYLSNESQEALYNDIVSFMQENSDMFPSKQRIIQTINVLKNRENKKNNKEEVLAEPINEVNASSFDYSSIMKPHNYDEDDVSIFTDINETDSCIFTEENIFQDLASFEQVGNSHETISTFYCDTNEESMDNILHTVMTQITSGNIMAKKIRDKKQVKTSILEIRAMLDHIEKLL